MNENKEDINNSKYSMGCNENINAYANIVSEVKSITEQISVTPTVIEAGSLFVKIPVVLAETNIIVPVEAIITLDQLAIEIKQIEKNVFLNQSRIIPFSEGDRPSVGILFIEGFIRMNIEYTTKAFVTNETLNSFENIRQCTVKVPFNYTTKITFSASPIFLKNTTPSELEFFPDGLKDSDEGIENNICNQSSFFTQFFNEKPFTELIRSDISQVNIKTDTIFTCKNLIGERLTKITEKLVLNLRIRVLQKQQIRLKSI